MSRGLDSGTITAVTGQRVLPAIFLEAQFTDGIINVWNGYGQISWSGKIWTGLSTSGGECLGSISSMVEDSTTTAQGITISLSGVDPTMLAHANAIQQGLPCRIWLNFFDTSGNIIGSAKTFAGLIDQPTIDEGSDKCMITIAVESRLSDLQRSQMRRWTDQDQKSRYPADQGFKFINTLQMWSATWTSN